MTYEEFIMAGAEERGAEVTHERDGLRLTLPNGDSSWHKLGGIAEQMYDRRVEAGYPFPGRWGSWHKGEEWRSGTAFEIPSPPPLSVSHPQIAAAV